MLETLRERHAPVAPHNAKHLLMDVLRLKQRDDIEIAAAHIHCDPNAPFGIQR